MKPSPILVVIGNTIFGLVFFGGLLALVAILGSLLESIK